MIANKTDLVSLEIKSTIKEIALADKLLNSSEGNARQQNIRTILEAEYRLSQLQSKTPQTA